MPDPDDRRPPRATWLRSRAATTALELVALAGLLVVDLELGARLAPGTPGGADVAGALVTALVAVVVAVVALVRRQLPWWLATGGVLAVSTVGSLVCAVVGSPSPSLTEAAALVVVTASGVRAAPTSRAAAGTGAAALVAVVGGVVLRVGPQATPVLLAVLVWGCAVVAGVAGRAVRTRRASALEEARRAERAELARELHDVVAHQVTGIVVQAQAAVAVARTDPARATQAFEAIQAAGAEALAGMRRMVGAIREDAGPDAPVTVRYDLADIAPLIDRFDAGRGRTTSRVEVPDAPLAPGIGESAYRIVREALTNVRRHAVDPSTHVCVRVVDDALRLEVGNDGVRPGSAPRGSGGFGLTGMAERVAALGGTLHAGADEADTWVVRVEIPAAVTR
ncbi:sensor histidine kinase [Cellulomonas iranensis]|uniref:sensor histidine kinase n=1 Tax=Cellulomonas iranensis TaxID=76862 RepID=UPI003D7DC375